MRKLLVLVALLLIFGAALCEGGRTVYDINAIYDEEAQALHVNMRAEYVNRTGKDMTEMYFNVYANLMRRESTLPYDNAALSAAFPEYYAPSGIEFTSVCFNGKPARYAFRGENECFLRIECDLKNGETGVFSFEYTLLLSENRAFQGCGKDVRLTLFYPSAAVYSEGEFILNAPSRAADYAYCELSDFRVHLICPADYTVVSGGEQITARVSDGIKQTEITLKNAPEAAIVLSRRLYSVSDRKITVYGSDRAQNRKTLKSAGETLSAYEKLFGLLPYESLSVVFCDSAVSMSRPGVVLLGDDMEQDELLLSRFLAEQYFGCAAITDPATDPFLRAGVSEYAALLAVEETKGEKVFTDTMSRMILPALRVTVPGSLTPDSYLSRFTNRSDFHLIVTLRGAAVMNEMRHAMGKEAFISSLKTYYEKGRGCVNTIEDFVSALSTPSFEAGNALIAWLYTIDDYANTTFDIYD